MVDVFLKRIKELEEEYLKTQQDLKEAKEKFFKVFSGCKVSKELKKEFLEAIHLLDLKDIKPFFKDGILTPLAFSEISNGLKGYLVFFDAADFNPLKKKFLVSYLAKISPFFTIEKEFVYGVIEDKNLKEVKELVKLPFFDPNRNEVEEIKLFKVIFDVDEINLETLQKAKTVFKNILNRPSFRSKEFIEYSLIKNRVVDFKEEKANKEKEKYSYVFDEKYPSLEIKLKKEFSNVGFVLALLEKIDRDLEKLKDARGLKMIVIRMLNFIESKWDDDLVLKQVKFLREQLK